MADVNPMTQFNTEGQITPVTNTENDNSTAPSAVETNSDQTQSQEGDQNSSVNPDGTKKEDRGFADDPRWQEREKNWNDRFNTQESRHVDELAKFRQETESRFASLQPKVVEQSSQDQEIPEWFNGDESSWGQYSQHTQQLVNTAVEQAIQKINSVQGEQQKAVTEATNYMEQQVTAIESDKTLNPQGDKIDRNKLLKTAEDNDLVDSKGHWNYKSAFKLMKPSEVFQAKAAINERKNLANASTSENRAESKPQPYATSADFSKPGARPW